MNKIEEAVEAMKSPVPQIIPTERQFPKPVYPLAPWDVEWWLLHMRCHIAAAGALPSDCFDLTSWFTAEQATQAH